MNVINCPLAHSRGFSGSSSGKEPACQRSRQKRHEFVPGSGASLGGGHRNPLQYSCLENPMARGAWRATVHGLQRLRTRPSHWAEHITAPHAQPILTSLPCSVCQAVIVLCFHRFHLSFKNHVCFICCQLLLCSKKWQWTMANLSHPSLPLPPKKDGELEFIRTDRNHTRLDGKD